MGVVTGTVPAGGVEVLPETSEADGEPLAEDWVGLLQLPQTGTYHSTLETTLLHTHGERETENCMGVDFSYF